MSLYFTTLFIYLFMYYICIYTFTNNTFINNVLEFSIHTQIYKNKIVS